MEPNKAMVSILLSQEEVYLLLRMIKAKFLPGLEQDPLGALSPEQVALGLIYSERALRARRLAFIKPDGGLEINKALMETMLVCAFPERSIFVHHYPANGGLQRQFWHTRENVFVTHRVHEEVLHEFAILPDQESACSQILTAINAEIFSGKQEGTIKISRDTLTSVRELAKKDGAKAAYNLIRSDPELVGNLESLTGVLAGAHQVTSLHFAYYPDGDEKSAVTQSLDILANHEYSWMMIPVTTETEKVILQSISSKAVEDQVSGWLNMKVKADV